MFPALAVRTPSRSSSSEAWRMALPAPRILNELTGWSVSSLNRSRHRNRRSTARAGCAWRHRRSPCAPARSPEAGSKRDDRARVLGLRALEHVLGSSEILDREAERLEHRQLVLGGATRNGADQDLAE